MVQKTARKCQWCKVYKASPSAPRMAPLPVARLTSHVRPFTFAGVDLCGPFLIRHGRSLVKRWVMLFTCLTVRAVHLEIVYTLSAESCKLGFRRFIALRGSPQEIYSDCGTNFQGLSNELKAEIAAIDQELATTFTNTNTKWHFNPPAAPHMGGVWERMVRSVKTALSTISTCRNPDGETFETFLAEAMAIVNSRPLTHVPLQAVDEEALTPNHFLMLSSTGVSQPTQPTTDLQSSLRSNWNHLQFLLDHYWARWIKEYLPAINQRRKWFAESRPISVGDLVMVVNEGIRNSWTRGRVVAVLPGKDGRIRSARVQTSAGVLTRPVVRLALLEVRNGGTAGPGDQQYGSGIVAEADDHTSKPPGELDRSLISPPGQNVSALMTQPKKGETVKN
ncbi:uncharacterized protein LOC120412868 [Culex pipiens pallens]|uniref:uncharacterized protein LOC120412868 n=1 Tax=Culex pipiens pallens TaxID=42434 RepID=UPI0022AAF17A|nr:uncharacterized protein LOC120412868 [Culex pipiens pallens]